MNMNKLIGFLCVLPLVIFILTLGSFLRVYELDKTGMEVDESTNLAVSMSIYNNPSIMRIYMEQTRMEVSNNHATNVYMMIYDVGYPSTKAEYDGTQHIYLYHPLVYFALMAGWFKLVGPGILAARELNVVVSIIALLLVFMIMLRRGKGTALLALLFITFDAWIIITNRMNYIENMQLVLILIGIWLFGRALRFSSSGPLPYVYAGIAIALAIIFKHIGVFLIIAIVANWLISRKNTRGHIITLLTIAVSVAVYVGIMFLIYGPNYITQQVWQFNRLLGVTGSRGMNFSVGTMIKVILDRYWIFVTTVLAIVVGWPLVIWDYLKSLVKNNVNEEDGLIISWALAGCVFAVCSQLKGPHYLILWLVPTYIFMAGKIVNWFKGRSLPWISVIAVTFVVINLLTWNYRVQVQQGDTLRESANYISTNLPQDSVVVTEQFLGTLIDQQYLRIDQATTEKLMKADYLAIYASSTQTIDDLPAIIQGWFYYCRPVLAVFKGFKDDVVICKINHDFK